MQKERAMLSSFLLDTLTPGGSDRRGPYLSLYSPREIWNADMREDTAERDQNGVCCSMH